MPVTASDIMTSPAITVSPQTGVREIAELLSRKHISAVPVCAPDGTLVGIVSEDDILKPFRESARKRRDWWLTMLAEGEQMSKEFLDFARQDMRTANDIMVRHVVAAADTDTVPELAELIVEHKIKRLPILREGRVVGIVSRSDLIASIARAPAMLV